jgi:predicted nucleic acid-binding protein
MNGIVKYLLDTNVLIGRLEGRPEALALLRDHGIITGNSGYSAITRIELLGFPSITPPEIQALEILLATMTRYSLSEEIENAAIQLRRSAPVKLPDAIILATAQIHGLQLLTLDQRLSALAAK